MTDTTTEFATLEFHISARDALEEMLTQARAIDNAWQHIKPEYGLAAYKSLSANLVHMVLGTRGTGNTQVFPDHVSLGMLSLFCRTEVGFVYGVVFHRTHRPDVPIEGDAQLGWIKAPLLGRYCMTPLDNGDDRYCASPIVLGERTCTHDEPVLPYAMPVPGEWSSHS